MTVPVPSELEFSTQGDGVTTVFPYPVRFLEPSELVVISRTSAGDNVLTLNSHYTVSGAGNENGGSITMLYVPLSSETIVRYRYTDAKQIVDLQDSQRNPAEAVEQQLDRLTMAIQDRSEKLTDIIDLANETAEGLTQEIQDRIDGDAALASLIGQAGSIEVPVYDTRLAVSLANVKPTVNVIRAGGYGMPGDGGDALYKRVASEPAHAGKVQSADGAWWELVPGVQGVDARALGCACDGVVDDTAMFQVFLDYGIQTGNQLILNGSARVTSGLTVTGTASSLCLRGVDGASIVAVGSDKITIAGTFDVFEIIGVNFLTFGFAPLWLADEADIDILRLRDCKASGASLFLTAQGDPLAANYSPTKWNVPNADTTVGYLDVGGCDIGNCIAGIVLPIVVEGADVVRNYIHDLTNSNTAGTDLEYTVVAISIGPLGGTVGGDFGPVGTNYSPDYDRIKNINISDNRIERLTQNVKEKACNGIRSNGFGGTISRNRLRDIVSPSGSDAGDAGNNDNEAIYVKGSEWAITSNVLHNCASTEAAIALKGYSEAIADYSTKVDPVGRNNLIANNVAMWDIEPAQGTAFAMVSGGPCSILNNRAIGLSGSGLSGCGVIIHGIGSDAVNEYPIIVDGNYFEGKHASFVLLRGGVNALTVGPGNVNNVLGGNGNCAYVEIAQARGQIFSNIKISGTHRVRNRTGATGYNAVVRISTTTNQINGLVMEGIVADHVDASNTSSLYKCLYFQGAGAAARGVVWRNNKMPYNISGQQVFDVPTADVEWEFDDDMEFTTTDASAILALNARCGTNAAASVSFQATAFNATGDEAAYYDKAVLLKRTSGDLAIVGSVVTRAEIESDATWNAQPTFGGNFARVQIQGDAANSVRWKLRVKAKSIMNN